MRNIHILSSLIVSALIITYISLLIMTMEYTRIQPSYIVEEHYILLPLPRIYSNMTVEEAVLLRRSIREYTSDPVKLEHLALILWAAYGITDPRTGFRASPSAGATYPLEVYVVIGEKGVLVENNTFLKPGVYKYDVYKHILVLSKEGDYREELYDAALGQQWVKNAPVNIVVCAVFERTTKIYGERGRTRYVPMEVGHLGQNVYLMATALGYGTVVIGAFSDEKVWKVINTVPDEVPMYIMPLGVPAISHRVSFEDVWEYILEKRR